MALTDEQKAHRDALRRLRLRQRHNLAALADARRLLAAAAAARDAQEKKEKRAA